MKGYVTEGSFVSCTQDSFGTPRQLQKRKSGHVKHNGKLLLVEYDAAITEQFFCNSPIKTILGYIAKAAIAVAFLATGPVGWIAFGVIAATAIVVTLIVSKHQCNHALDGIIWSDTHKNVYLNGNQNCRAVLYLRSTMICNKGGALVASDSFETANSLSNEMALHNWESNGIHAVACASSTAINCAILGPEAGFVDLGVSMTIDIAVDNSGNGILQTVDDLNLIKTPGLDDSAIKVIMKAPILSWELIKESIKSTVKDIGSFFKVWRVAPRMTTKLIAPMLGDVLKGAAVGLLASVVESRIDRYSTNLAKENKEEIIDLKNKDSGTSLVALDY